MPNAVLSLLPHAAYPQGNRGAEVKTYFWVHFPLVAFLSLSVSVCQRHMGGNIIHEPADCGMLIPHTLTDVCHCLCFHFHLKVKDVILKWPLSISQCVFRMGRVKQANSKCTDSFTLQASLHVVYSMVFLKFDGKITTAVIDPLHIGSLSTWCWWW